jgi:hypothetical protein
VVPMLAVVGVLPRRWLAFFLAVVTSCVLIHAGCTDLVMGEGNVIV